MSEEQTFLTIAVAGNMNPSIHHPAWYGRLQILSEDEMKEAMADASIQTTAALAQFTTSRFLIVCDSDTWQAHALEPTAFDRALGIASKTFENLDSTPVSGFALTSRYQRATPVADVGAHLASGLQRCQIGFAGSATGSLSAGVRLTENRDSSVLTVIIEPSVKRPDFVFVAIHSAYSISKEGYFHLAPLLAAALPSHLSEAQRNLEGVLASFGISSKEA